MKKRIIAIIMMCCMLFMIVPSTIHAVQIYPVQPMWDNTNSFTAKINFSGTTGTVSVVINGDVGVTNITADISLYYKNTSGSWVEIEKDWDYDVDQDWLAIDESFTGVAGREYKIEVNGTVTKGGYAEEISKTATATCPRTK